VPIGDQGHRGVAVAVAVALGRRHEPLHLGLGQVLASLQLGVGRPPGGNCSFYGGWRHQPQVRFGHRVSPYAEGRLFEQESFYKQCQGWRRCHHSDAVNGDGPLFKRPSQPLSRSSPPASA
jgi:hypothetical protein